MDQRSFNEETDRMDGISGWFSLFLSVLCHCWLSARKYIGYLKQPLPHAQRFSTWIMEDENRGRTWKMDSEMDWVVGRLLMKL